MELIFHKNMEKHKISNLNGLLFLLGFSFKEVKHAMASSHKVDCCHFSFDGKLLVTGGRDKTVRPGLIQL